MLPSRDSGCKGTNIIPYPQVFACFIGFFKHFYKNRSLSSALWAARRKPHRMHLAALSDAIGCLDQLLVVAHSLLRHQHEDEGNHREACRKLEMIGAHSLWYGDDAKEDEGVVDAPEHVEECRDRANAHLQLAVLIEEYVRHGHHR